MPMGGGRPSRKFGSKEPAEDRLTAEKVLTAFGSLPRVLKLVWDVQPFYTLTLAVLYILQGFLPLITALVNGLLIQGVVDAIQKHGEGNTKEYVIWIVGAQFAVQALSSLLSTVSNIVQQLLQTRTSMAIQLMVMEKANSLDLRFFEDAEFYDKLQQVQNEASSRPAGMISQTFNLGRTLITFVSMGLVLVRLEWWIAIVALLAPIPAFIANVRYGWWGFLLARRQSPERRELNYYGDVMTTDKYNKEIKLFGLGDFFITRFRSLSFKFYDETRALVVPRYMASFAWGLGTFVANGLIYLYIALRAVSGSISLAELTVYTQAALQVGQSFQSLLSAISSTYENNLYVNTLFDFLAFKPAITSPVDALKPQGYGLQIEFRNVSFAYPGREGKGQALHNVSFSIAAGEAIALVGRNGAGKTTVVKLLTRLYDPDDGQILVNGRDIKEYDLDALRREIGVIFQDYVTYYLSAGDNIGVGKIEEIEDQSEIEIAAHKSGADAVIAKLPDGYDSMLGKWFDKGQQLSGGEWQKIALARAFMRDAQLLILDEPTSALDPQAEYEVFARFRELTEGKSAVFISHRFSTVRLADRIIVLENGGVLEQGTHEDLLARGGRYAELFSLQAEAYR